MPKDTSIKVIEALCRSLLYRRRIADTLPALERKAIMVLSKAGATTACGETLMLSIVDGRLQVHQIPCVDPLQMTVWEASGQEPWHIQSAADEDE